VFALENEMLRVEVAEKGAEIKRIHNKKTNTELLWSGDVSFWGRVSPILFPIVGRVAKDTYLVDGQEYQLSQHGFARDEAFQLVSHSETEVWLELAYNEASLAKYPFKFVLRIGYLLDGATVTVKWEVKNVGEGSMPFSIGAHPAISTSLQEGDVLEDYYLHLETSEKVETYLFDAENGLIKDEKDVIMPDMKFLPLSKDLFEDYPTVILEGETAMSLKSYNHEHGVDVKFEGFPYVGIWAPINEDGNVAPFVCIEPWFGMADTNPTPGELKQKKGIQELAEGTTFEAAYSLTFK